jgi:hypothetical protein
MKLKLRDLYDVLVDAVIPAFTWSNSGTSREVESAKFEAAIKELDAAVERRRLSFEQLTTLIDYLEDPKLSVIQRKVALVHYPGVLDAFEETHGRLTDLYCSNELECYLGQTVPRPTSRLERLWRWMNIAGTYPPGRPQFHYLYDLSKAGPDGGLLLTRLQQLAAEAPRFLSGQDLSDWVDRLYSSATDLAGVLEPSLQA